MLLTFTNTAKYAGLPNFKKVMAILILAPANYLLDLVSPGGPTMFGARRKILGFKVPRWPENPFPTKYPFTFHLKKANSFAISIASPNFCHI